MTHSSSLAHQLRQSLEAFDKRIVFAESCTAGLVAATMAGVPGVSQFLCGSFVTYRESAKESWLNILRSDLVEHSAVSDVVTKAMAENALARTDEANLAVAVTGHLGPNAPEALDGIVYVAAVTRTLGSVRCKRIKLTATARLARQQEAADCVLQATIDFLSGCFEIQTP